MARRSNTLDNLYFDWLVDLVKFPEGRSYWKLFRLLYSTEFIVLVANDDNRALDGIDLRDLFIDSEDVLARLLPDPDWEELPCSVLEMMAALSIRLETFEDRKSVSDWFWVLIHNLGLEIDDREFTNEDYSYIFDGLDILNYRQYNYSGLGGLFPIKNPTRDQRDIEIWDQMSDYLRGEV